MNQIRDDKLQLFWRYLGQYFHSFIFIDLCVKDIKLLQVKYRQAPANISLIKAILLFHHVLLPILGQIAKLAFLCVISHCQIIVRIKPIMPFLNKRLNYLKTKDPLWILNILAAPHILVNKLGCILMSVVSWIIHQAWSSVCPQGKPGVHLMCVVVSVYLRVLSGFLCCMGAASSSYSPPFCFSRSSLSSLAPPLSFTCTGTVDRDANGGQAERVESDAWTSQDVKQKESTPQTK